MTRICVSSFALLFVLAAGFAPTQAAGAPDNAARAELASYAPPLVTRDKWQAKPALPGLVPQTPAAIIIHHTGERQNRRIPVETKMRNLQTFSQRPGQVGKHAKPAWPDVPYHYYIDVTGRIAEGRDVRFAGDTNTGYDTRGYIQVVLEGNFDIEQPAPEQMNALRDLLVWLSLSWNVPDEKISVHKDHAPTGCPGRNFMAMLPSFRAGVRAHRGDLLTQLCEHAYRAPSRQPYCWSK